MVSCTRFQVDLALRLRCDCKAYRRPHQPSVGLCKIDLLQNPPQIKRPRKGRAAELFDRLDRAENEAISEGADALITAIREIKQFLQS